ncbi:MAG: hypothetical protein ACE5R6_19725 [Candidatus Heimdallarchaeota archaeon]
MHILSLTTNCYLLYSFSFRKVVELLYDLYNLRVSHTSLANWLRLFGRTSQKFSTRLIAAHIRHLVPRRDVQQAVRPLALCFRSVKRMAASSLNITNHAAS